MKSYLFLILTLLIINSCCSKPAPEKMTNLSFSLTTKKDSVFFYNIKRIYALGAKSNNPVLQEYPKIFESRKNEYSLFLPISYASDSTIYVFENNIKANDTLIVYYKRHISFGENDNCGYQQTLAWSPKDHYSTLKNYKLNVNFGTYGVLKGLSKFTENACTIKLIEK